MFFVNNLIQLCLGNTLPHRNISEIGNCPSKLFRNSKTKLQPQTTWQYSVALSCWRGWKNPHFLRKKKIHAPWPNIDLELQNTRLLVITDYTVIHKSQKLSKKNVYIVVKIVFWTYVTIEKQTCTSHWAQIFIQLLHIKLYYVYT